jgi:hypothetical protein
VPIADAEVTSLIHAALEQKQLLLRLQMVNTGYLDAELLVTSQREHGIELLGPTRPDYKW